MKILIVAQQFFPDSVGGSARVAYEQACELVKRGHSVYAVIPKQWTASYDTTVIDGIHIFRYGTGVLHPFGQSFVDVRDSWSVIQKVVSQAACDVIIAHQPTIGSIVAKRLSHIPLIYMFHASVPREVKFQGLTGRGVWKRIFLHLFIRWLTYLEKTTIQKSSVVLTLSGYSERLMKSLYPQVSSYRRIPAGVNVEKYMPTTNKKSIRAIIGMPDTKIIFLTVRRLVPRMGLESLIRAFGKLLTTYSNAKLYIVGEGLLYDSLHRLIHKQGLEDFITLTGRVREEDLPMFYQAADCFVLSTLAYEGLGIATLEAMASGLPVLGTPIGATEEILKKVDANLLFASSRLEDMTHGMRWFLDEGIHDTTLSDKGLKVVHELYTLERAGDALEKVCVEVIHSSESL